MIDVDAFYRQLGATQSLGADQQLVLNDEVRVFCNETEWTAIFEAMSPREDRLDAAFEICRTAGGLIPFTTRSGQLAVRGPSGGVDDATTESVQRLRAVLRHMEQGLPTST